jgi:hypothetical protein
MSRRKPETLEEALAVLPTLPTVMGNFPMDEVGNYVLALNWDNRNRQWEYGYFLRGSTYIMRKTSSLLEAIQELVRVADHIESERHHWPRSRILNDGRTDHLNGEDLA